MHVTEKKNMERSRTFNNLFTNVEEKKINKILSI